MSHNEPLSMSECYRIGLSGDCGETCPVLLRGECEEEEEFLEDYGVSRIEDLPWNKEK